MERKKPRKGLFADFRGHAGVGRSLRTGSLRIGVCVYIYTYTHIIFAYASIHMVHIYIYVYIYVYIYIHMFVCSWIYVGFRELGSPVWQSSELYFVDLHCVPLCVKTNICLQIYSSVHTRIHIYIYAYTHQQYMLNLKPVYPGLSFRRPCQDVASLRLRAQGLGLRA